MTVIEHPLSQVTPKPLSNCLSRSEWQTQQQQHKDRLAPYADDRVSRSVQKRKHPVRDFLFEYYSHRPAQLLRWTPGMNIFLEEANQNDLEWGRLFQVQENGLILLPDSFPEQRRNFIQWSLNYLEGIRERTPSFHCFGLHEWAMVYREPNIRHSQTPLRLSPEEITQFVDSQELRCTHYDAYRFFSLEAVPKNKFPLSREVTDQFDQRGCVHVNMDLYKWAYKITPWCPSSILADAFLLAWESRNLDMRASPYDLRELGIEPILIETKEGREQYVEEQRELSKKSIPIRDQLIEVYRQLAQSFA